MFEIKTMLDGLNSFGMEFPPIPQSIRECLNILDKNGVHIQEPVLGKATFLRSGIDINSFENALKDLYHFIIDRRTEKINEYQFQLISAIIQLFQEVLKAFGQDGFVSCRSVPIPIPIPVKVS